MRSLAGRQAAAVAEFAIKPVAGGDKHCRRDQARQDINDVMVSAVNRGEAEQDGDHRDLHSFPTRRSSDLGVSSEAQSALTGRECDFI